MNKMPCTIKNKIRQYNATIIKSAKLCDEIESMLEEYGVPVDNLVGTADEYSDDPQTEALAYINNAECTTEDALEDAIRQIEDVFLWFQNK